MAIKDIIAGLDNLISSTSPSSTTRLGLFRRGSPTSYDMQQFDIDTLTLLKTALYDLDRNMKNTEEPYTKVMDILNTCFRMLNLMKEASQHDHHKNSITALITLIRSEQEIIKEAVNNETYTTLIVEKGDKVNDEALATVQQLNADKERERQNITERRRHPNDPLPSPPIKRAQSAPILPLHHQSSESLTDLHLYEELNPSPRPTWTTRSRSAPNLQSSSPTSMFRPLEAVAEGDESMSFGDEPDQMETTPISPPNSPSH